MADQTFTSGQVLTAAQMTTLQNNIALTYIKSVNVGTTVGSVTVSDCFSSAFDSYEILYSGGLSSNTEVLYMTLAGITTGSYYSAGAQNTSGSGTYNGIGAAAQTKWQVASCTPTRFGLTMTIHHPYLVLQKYTRCEFASDYSTGWTGGVCNNTLSVTAFTFLPGAGTLTGGTISVYGYRKA